jgi:hypothetical protein
MPTVAVVPLNSEHLKQLVRTPKFTEEQCGHSQSVALVGALGRVIDDNDDVDNDDDDDDEDNCRCGKKRSAISLPMVSSNSLIKWT